MRGYHGGCVRLPNKDSVDYIYFSCYHYEVAGSVCDTPWVYTALGAYRYFRIININNFICYIILTEPLSCLIFLL